MATQRMTTKQQRYLNTLVQAKLGNSESPFEKTLAKEFRTVRMMLDTAQASKLISEVSMSADIFDLAERLEKKPELVGERRAKFIRKFFELTDQHAGEIDVVTEDYYVGEAALKSQH